MKVKVLSPEREGQFKGKGYWSAQMHWPVGVTVREVTEDQLKQLKEDEVLGRLSVLAVGDDLADAPAAPPAPAGVPQGSAPAADAPPPPPAGAKPPSKK